jgi:hypothetical protein
VLGPRQVFLPVIHMSSKRVGQLAIFRRACRLSRSQTTTQRWRPKLVNRIFSSEC